MSPEQERAAQLRAMRLTEAERLERAAMLLRMCTNTDGSASLTPREVIHMRHLLDQRSVDVPSGL